MEMNRDAPGNISQKGVNSEADSETGFDHRAHDRAERTAAGKKQVDDELGFDPESPDVSDPAVDPLHPARTSNDPVPPDEQPTDDDQTSSGGRGI